MAEIVHMPHPLQPGPVEIDDSRLQALWARQNRRSMLLAGAAGALAVLAGVALVIMALRFNTEPPVVNVAGPVVNVPEQPAPVVNVPAPIVNVTPNIEVKVPQAAPPPAPLLQPRTGESKIVTEYHQFHTVTVGNYGVVSGWKFRNSNDTKPYLQYCYVQTSRTGILELAEEGKVSSTIDNDARAVNVAPALAKTLAQSCRWRS
jgi:hypothetical protein